MVKVDLCSYHTNKDTFTMRVETLTLKILSLMQNVGKSQAKFLVHFFTLVIAFRGRANFENLARQGNYNESTYRNNFDKDFDFLKFNQLLVEQYCSEEVAIAFDPSFISKSGKCTPGLGYFWSGGAGRTQKGLEIGGFGAIDIVNNTCLHLVAKQTLDHKKYDSLIEYYVETARCMSQQLQQVSTVLVVDAYFSKYTFVEPMGQCGFEVISRFRDDAVLFYTYLGPQKKGRGRPRKYQGRVDVKHPDENHFRLIIKDAGWQAYEGVVFSKALKRWVKVVLLHHFKANGELKSVKIYFSTNLERLGSDLLLFYKTRFQIEFLYRDAKQFTGLMHCQSRKEKRLDFHFNASLTAVSLAKAAHHLSTPFEQRKPFSMFSIKAQYFNELLLNRFFYVFGINPNSEKINSKYLSLRNFGKIAA